MSDIIQFQNDVASRLLSKQSLNGVTILSVDDQDIINELTRAVARLGTAVIIGTPKGINASPDSPGLQVTLTVACVVMENVALNRNRRIFATVANQAARLDLAGTVEEGWIVEQTDVSTGLYSIASEGSVSDELDISTNASAAALDVALNSMESITNAGGVTVTGDVASGYTVTWNEVGARALMQALKGDEFPFGGMIYVERETLGDASTQEVQIVKVRQWFWLVAGSGASPSNWGYFFTSKEILQIVMRALHRYSPANNQTIIAAGFNYGPREDVVDIVANFTIRLYLPADGGTTPIP